jgi:hypothetical protein
VISGDITNTCSLACLAQAAMTPAISKFLCDINSKDSTSSVFHYPSSQLQGLYADIAKIL